MWQTIEKVYVNPAAGDVVADNSPDRVALTFDWFGTDRVFISTIPDQIANAGLAISQTRPPLQLWYRQVGDEVTVTWYCGTGNTGNLTVIEVIYRDDTQLAPMQTGVPLLPVGPPGSQQLMPPAEQTVASGYLRPSSGQ